MSELRALLRSMRFRLERTHSDLDVDLWRQGAINIVLNSTAGADGDVTRVCDIGLRVDNADHALNRANALGAFRQISNGEPGALNAPSINTVGSDLLHLMDAAGAATRVWEHQFVPCLSAESPQPAGLRRVDHIAQTMPLADMDSWALWYITTFELHHETLQLIGDQDGQTRSQAIAASEGQVRLNLNGAADPNTLSRNFVQSHTDGGVQHVALSTDDIFETASLLERSGFASLEIHRGYYEALAARFGIDSDLIDRLRRFQLLYDRDAQGEYFQLYSRAHFGGFFFEIVERRNGYEGYGANNAGERLKAQQLQKRVE